MDDQRVEFGASLGREHAGDGAVVGRIGAEAVDGFGREGDEAAAPENTGRFGDRARLGCLPNRAHGR